ncbi:MAG TPA: serine hydrolase domain-containing protein [Acidimicrobiales bacterium]|nr:serine hydrolase domain-containing protein [Acidimicrobiales bacterium]
MTALTAYRARLDGMLAELAAEHGPPGAVCGVLADDEVEVVPWGVANIATGAPVIPTTLFQLGTITKAYTATLVMQAVNAGVISLDESVRAQLQEFTVADPAATIEITPRHLLTHTSGIEGDHLIDTGWNADALARYMVTLAGLGQIHPTDAAYSFCNTGYAVAGRLLEVATGEHFDRVLRRRLTRPLGCRATLTLPQHALLHSVAVGHVQARGGPATRQSRWALTRSNGPMGGVMAPAGELLAFARMHMSGGRGANGVDLLAPAAVDAMQRPHTDTPVPGEAQALGWTVTHWGDLTCLGLDADTFGQRAMLRVVPERRLAICVMANSPTGAPLAEQLIDRVAVDLLDLAPGSGPGGAATVGRAGDGGTDGGGAEQVDLGRLAGTYDRLHQRITVSVPGADGRAGESGSDGRAGADDGAGRRVQLVTEPSGVLQALGVGHAELDLQVVEGAGSAGRVVCAGDDPVSGQRVMAVFTPPAGAQPAGLYLRGRLHRRTG